MDIDIARLVFGSLAAVVKPLNMLAQVDHRRRHARAALLRQADGELVRWYGAFRNWRSIRRSSGFQYQFRLFDNQGRKSGDFICTAGSQSFVEFGIPVDDIMAVAKGFDKGAAIFILRIVQNNHRYSSLDEIACVRTAPAPPAPPSRPDDDAMPAAPPLAATVPLLVYVPP